MARSSFDAAGLGLLKEIQAAQPSLGEKPTHCPLKDSRRQAFSGRTMSRNRAGQEVGAEGSVEENGGFV